MSEALLKAGIEPDPVIEAYKKDVDRTLIRENLKLTVAARIDKHTQMQKFVTNWRRAGSEARRREVARTDQAP